MKGPIVQHSRKSVEHYGPPALLSKVREVMGGIDLDPASCALANRIVQAEAYYCAQGLEFPWWGRVYLNPPGGETIYQGKTVNQAALWWATLAYRFSLGLVSEAIFTIFNLEIFRYAQRYQVPHPLDFAYCMPVDRIDFYRPTEDGTDVEGQGSPAHPNAIVYLGPNGDRFREVFEAPGEVSGRVWLPR